ncbi:MAG: DUF4252 domain-containing protein [Muribaculaceae bacterium]|nr:DUF4252 domain-containing protein [Muribaculaceae bacterium]
MKTIKLLLVWVMSMMCISCSAQRTFSEISSMKGVTSVYVGKTMLKLASSSMALDSDVTAVNMSKIIKNLTSIEIISCEDKKVAEKVQKKCDSILSKYQMDVITEVNSNDTNVEISGAFEKDGETLKMILLSVRGGDSQPTYILMKGKININTLTDALIFPKEININQSN